MAIALRLAGTSLSLLASVPAMAQHDMYGRSIATQGQLTPSTVLQRVTTKTSNGENAGFTFSPYTATAIGSWPDAVEIGDVTGDGRADVVLTTTFFYDPENDYRLFVFPQGANGTLGAPTSYSYSQSAARTGLAILDLDGENALDVVVGGGVGLSIFRSTSNGSLLESTTVATDQAINVLIPVDLTGSGIEDLVSVSWSSGGYMHLSGHDGTFESVPWAVNVVGYNSMARGDLDGDGDADVAVASGQGFAPHIWLYRNDGNGTLTEFAAMDGACDTWAPRGIGIGDINNDGFADVVVSAGGNQSSSCIVVFNGTGGGAFAEGTTYPSYDIPETLRVADIDRDGREDIVVLHDGWLSLGVYFQQADGTLQTEQLFPIPDGEFNAAHGLAVGDFSGDGCTDVAIADNKNGLVTLMGQQCVIIFRDGFE